MPMPNEAGRPGRENASVPLVVDVDGTLVAGDLLLEGAIRLFASSPFAMLRSTLPLLRDRAALKRAISRSSLSPASLVLNPAVVDEIRTARQSGRPVWLATGADRLAVEPLASQFDVAGVFASNDRVNLVGRAKAEVLVERFGKGGFDYVGNEARDLFVWTLARRAIAVDTPAGLARKIRALRSDARFLPGLGKPVDYLRALRPHQWVKNALVFVPVAAAHVVEVLPYLAALGAFAVLCAIASGAYAVNDLLDIQHDRRHASKRLRPVAAGKVRVLPMLALGTGLAVAGTAAALWLSPALGLCALAYIVLALGYSLLLKRAMVLDVIVLALLYVVRVVAGGAAASVPVSPWLLAFSMFFFVSLAVVKRRKELVWVAERGDEALDGRGYVVGDAAVITMLGVASAFGAVLVLALYVQSAEVAVRYARPELLWLVCPLLLYWLGRMLLLANRGAVNDDPVVFALRDRASWITGLLIAAVLLAAL